MSNETSSFSTLSCILILTGSTDYARWSLAIKNAAMMADVWEYLDGTETHPEVAAKDQKPTADEKVAIKAWKKANSKALGLMGSTCTEELQLHIDEYCVTTTLLGEAHTSDSPPTAAEVWAHLATKYEKKDGVEFGCLKVVNQMSYLTVGSLENTSRLVDVSLNWTINSTG